MNVDEYLTRINCLELRNSPPTLENLKKLMIANLCNVTFENADFMMGDFQKFSLEDAYDRIVHQGKGGYCVQLNIVFYWLLKELGYEVILQPTYIYNNFLQKYYRLPLHMAPFVWFENETGRNAYYADIGTIRVGIEPLIVEPGLIQQTKMGVYRFLTDEKHPGYFYLQRTKNGSDLENCNWQIQIKFKLSDPLPLSAFEELNDWIQTPEHPINFARNGFCRCLPSYTQLLLIGRKLTKTTCSESGEEVTVRIIDDDDELHQIIREVFKVNLDFDRFKPIDNYNFYTYTEENKPVELEIAKESWKKFLLP